MDAASYYDTFGEGHLTGTTRDGFRIEAYVESLYGWRVELFVWDSESDLPIVSFRATPSDPDIFDQAVKQVLDFCREIAAREDAKQRTLETGARNRFFR